MPNPLADVDPNSSSAYHGRRTLVAHLATAYGNNCTDYRHQQSIITSVEHLNPASITPLSEKWKQLCLDTLSDLDNVRSSSSGHTINNNLYFRGRECVIEFMEDRRPELRSQVAEKWKHLYYDAIREFEQTAVGRISSTPGDNDAARIQQLEEQHVDVSDQLHHALAQLQEGTNELACVSAELHRVQNQLEHVEQDKVNEKWRAEHHLRKVHRLKEEGERMVAGYQRFVDDTNRHVELETTRQRFKQQARQAYYAALKLEVATLEGGETAHVKARMECVLHLMEEYDPAL